VSTLNASLPPLLLQKMGGNSGRNIGTPLNSNGNGTTVVRCPGVNLYRKITTYPGGGGGGGGGGGCLIVYKTKREKPKTEKNRDLGFAKKILLCRYRYIHTGGKAQEGGNRIRLAKEENTAS